MADDVAVLTELNEQFIEAVRRGSWEMLAPLLSPGSSSSTAPPVRWWDGTRTGR